MHELSVAQSLVELASEHVAADGNGGVVIRVRIRIGAMSGVVPAALLSALPAAAAGTVLGKAAFDIEEVPVTIWCDACAAERSIEGQRLRCIACGQRAARLVTGRELEIASLEIAP